MMKMKKPIISFLITLIFGSFIIRISGSSNQSPGNTCLSTHVQKIKK